jgi:tetratricopeptide (TPR) repeat protein
MLSFLRYWIRHVIFWTENRNVPHYRSLFNTLPIGFGGVGPRRGIITDHRPEPGGPFGGEGRIMRRTVPLTLVLLAILVWPARPLAADDGREARWDLLHRGYVRQYVDECLDRRDQPGWDLEDEVDLAMGYWWLMAEDFNSRAAQDQLFDAVERGIDRCRDAIETNGCPPARKALLGNLITMAGQVQVARGRYLSAARRAREGKGMLEEVRRANPEIGDTYFSLGLYLYYADLSSPLVRSLQRLLFFPPGDKRLGLFYLEKAALESRRFGPMARVALATIYSSEEKRHSHALSHLRTLRRQYPENPLFLSLTAEALSILGDHAAARELLDEADDRVARGVPPYLPRHQNAFVLIRAQVDLNSFILDAAHRNFTRVLDGGDSGLSWVRPMAAHGLARLHVISGDEEAFEALLRRMSKMDENGRHRKRAKRLPARLAGQGYISDLHPVFRHWCAGRLQPAENRLRHLLEIKGNMSLFAYLLGEVLLQRGQPEAAMEQFRAFLGQGKHAMPWAAGWSLIRLGDIQAAAGDLDAARHWYRRAESRAGFKEHHAATHRLDLLARQEARRRHLAAERNP